MKSIFLIKNLILAIIFIVFIFSLFNFFLIKDIDCQTDNQEICEQFDFLKNKSLFFTNLDDQLLAQVFESKDGQAIQVLDYQKKLPQTLILEVKNQDPSYRLEIQDQFFLVNQENFLAEDDGQYELLTVKLSEKYQNKINEKKIDPSLNNKIIDLVDSLEKIEVDEILVNESESYLFINGLRYIFEFTQEDPVKLAAKISLMQKEIAVLEHDEDILQVDLRFKNPVIKFVDQVVDQD